MTKSENASRRARERAISIVRHLQKCTPDEQLLALVHAIGVTLASNYSNGASPEISGQVGPAIAECAKHYAGEIAKIGLRS